MREGEGNGGRGRRSGRRGWSRPVSAIPTAGMADIAFLLLIFFMLIVYEPDRTTVDLPDSEIRAGSDSDAALVILAVGDGANLGVAVNDRGRLEALCAKARGMADVAGDPVAVDGAGPYRQSRRRGWPTSRSCY